MTAAPAPRLSLDLGFLADRPIALLGLGKSGLAAAAALTAAGIEVRAWDDGADVRARAADAGIPLADLGDDANWDHVDTLVLSPGIPHRHPAPHPIAERARAHGAAIVCDVDLLGRAAPDARYVGITGTNGKSTTTALIGHLLQAAGRTIAIGGNLGPPALSLAALDADGIYVLELSSYQLERTDSISYDVAVLLNVSPDHLDRHGGMDGYVAAKKRIFRGAGPASTAVIGVDDETCRRLRAELEAAGDCRVVPISGTGPVAGGVYAEAGILTDDRDGTARIVTDLTAIPTLPGSHNWQNAAAAYAACRALDVPGDEVAAALATFPGLAHRQELVATRRGVRFVNDSKATNADAAARALASYARIYWIAGGRAKEGGIAALAPFWPKIAHAFLIGEAAGDFVRTLDGAVPHTISGDLDTAVAQAAAMAEPGSVVLLSPACASWDQFASFEARGDAFRRAVAALPAETLS